MRLENTYSLNGWMGCRHGHGRTCVDQPCGPLSRLARTTYATNADFQGQAKEQRIPPEFQYSAYPNSGEVKQSNLIRTVLRFALRKIVLPLYSFKSFTPKRYNDTALTKIYKDNDNIRQHGFYVLWLNTCFCCKWNV